MIDELLDFEKMSLIDSTIDELCELWLKEGDIEQLLQLRQILARQLENCDWAINEAMKTTHTM